MGPAERHCVGRGRPSGSSFQGDLGNPGEGWVASGKTRPGKLTQIDPAFFLDWHMMYSVVFLGYQKGLLRENPMNMDDLGC